MVIKKEYIDQYGLDSLPKLKDAKKFGMDVFVTINESLLEDREELEKEFGVPIRTPEEMNEELDEPCDEEKETYKKEGICSLCGGGFSRWGHNPEPLKPFEERCCDICNETKVIPERIRIYKEERSKQ